MSIGPIEDPPTDEDTVAIYDPGDTTVEPSYGRDTQPYDLRTTTLHDDPQGEAFTHLGVSGGRELDLDDWLGHRDETADPDAMFTTGTEDRGERWIHDEALQVRQLIPTQYMTSVYQLTSDQPVSVCPRRPERMTVVLYNNGANTVYISGRQATAGPTTGGFPILAGNVLHLDAIMGTYASVVNGSPSTLAVLDQFRTDNKAE